MHNKTEHYIYLDHWLHLFSNANDDSRMFNCLIWVIFSLKNKMMLQIKASSDSSFKQLSPVYTLFSNRYHLCARTWSLKTRHYWPLFSQALRFWQMYFLSHQLSKSSNTPVHHSISSEWVNGTYHIREVNAVAYFTTNTAWTVLWKSNLCF